jgi:hypothetical protein
MIDGFRKTTGMDLYGLVQAGHDVEVLVPPGDFGETPKVARVVKVFEGPAWLPARLDLDGAGFVYADDSPVWVRTKVVTA